jgi:hypothetical protein
MEGWKYGSRSIDKALNSNPSPTKKKKQTKKNKHGRRIGA